MNTTTDRIAAIVANIESCTDADYPALANSLVWALVDGDFTADEWEPVRVALVARHAAVETRATSTRFIRATFVADDGPDA